MTSSDRTADVFSPDLVAGRTALITGGGSGIGYGIAECLAAAGASVSLFSRTEERVENAAARLRDEYGGAAIATVGDVREPEALEAAVTRTRSELGSVDFLVNNAAGNFYAPTAELSVNGWRAVIEIDLYGTFHACRAVLPAMIEGGFGRIVSISMTLHHRGWPLMAHATAAKAGVDALTRTLALEWARHGINVNAVAPGPIPTEGVKKAFSQPADESTDMFGERALEGFAERFIPAGRLGHTHDIGRMVTFLCSPAGDWITGAVFVVDGGESLASPRAIPTHTE
ncbi:MAG: SDR family oxidoreductase [Gemmatimonadetes bacterium]|nr:SDR family oxidoreductase [Gemmatimonadota bacterium]